MSESTLRLTLDARTAMKHAPDAVKLRQRTRLAEIVDYARTNSPYYRELYQELPERVDDPTLLPVTGKQPLMARFDDWVTDRAVTLEQAQAFAADPELVGEQFQGKYMLATTSGTSGKRGIFLHDDRDMAVSVALGLRRAQSWYGTGDRIRMLARGGRQAFVIATGGHFVGAAGATQITKNSRLARRALRIFPVHRPLPDLVAELNHYRPAIVLGYASVVAMLASEQEAGRLRIDPVLVQPAGESLPAAEFDRIATAFGAKVRTVYSATECSFMGNSCEHGWLHVDSDWCVLEPVDADYQPTPPGEPSHTVLVSNLARRVQPILRYDLGDGILTRPDPCPCGNPLLAIQVQGRAADVLTFPTDHGERVSLPPLAFATTLDRTPGIEQFQIVQNAPTNLRVRLRPATGTDPESVWRAVHAELTRLLTEHKADHVTLDRAQEPPQQSPGGKYRRIIPLS